MNNNALYESNVIRSWQMILNGYSGQEIYNYMHTQRMIRPVEKKSQDDPDPDDYTLTIKSEVKK